MLNYRYLGVFSAIVLFGACHREAEKPLLLHYDKPAQYFEEALPMGNGTLGAMIGAIIWGIFCWWRGIPASKSHSLIAGITGGAMTADEFVPGPLYIQGDHSDADFRNMVLTPIVK